jgi:hypothetical protein
MHINQFMEVLGVYHNNVNIHKFTSQMFRTLPAQILINKTPYAINFKLYIYFADIINDSFATTIPHIQ